MNTCKECIHAEMCKWIDELEGRGCDFFDGEQEPCDDAISREDATAEFIKWQTEVAYAFGRDYLGVRIIQSAIDTIRELPPVTQKSGKCKNCKYFEYDSVAKVDGIPLIVAHEICNKWGNGCKTSEDGYCYLFEPRASEEDNEVSR